MQQKPPLQHKESSCSLRSDYSYDSDYSISTAPTTFSGYRHQEIEGGCYETDRRYFREGDYEFDNDDAVSVLTYTSTTPSEAGDNDDAGYVVYDDGPLYDEELYEPTAVPSKPSEFAQCFPSSRRLYINHDDTVDGNMNLRVDTKAEHEDGRRVDLTLFHLRMHDLKNRDFSLRRYCRESGREVCHSTRKYAPPSLQKRMPSFQQSMSNALASLRSKSDVKSATRATLKRTDSGYDSMSDDDDGEYDSQVNGKLPIPTNTTNLEFSNYCHMGLKRRGATASKRYEFDYWGASYTWRRKVVRKRAAGNDPMEGPTPAVEEISYHLYSNQAQAAIAHIVPTLLTPDEAAEEEANGGWVPPCSMWIVDGETRKDDIAEVIVATGLLALVDDSIKNRWHRKDRFRITLPTVNFARKDDTGAAKRLIDEVFGRKGPKDVTKASGRSPMRQIAPKY